MLIRLVFLNQRGNLIVIQPEPLTRIKEVKRLGKELIMIEIVLEIDMTRHTDTDETTRTRGIDKRLQLVSSADKRGITAIEFDGLAVRRTELDIARRQQIFQHNLLRRGSLVELIDIDEGKRGEGDIQVELVLEV